MNYNYVCLMQAHTFIFIRNLRIISLNFGAVKTTSNHRFLKKLYVIGKRT